MTGPRLLTVAIVLLLAVAVGVAAVGRSQGQDAADPVAGKTRSPPADPFAPAARPSPDPTATPSPVTPSPTAPPVIRDVFDADRAFALAVTLADAGPRPAGSDGDLAARSLVASELRSAGWSVEQVMFPLPQGGVTANVVATLPGAPSKRPHVVLGAHLDTVAGSPGANDNATGVAVLVEVARELRDEAAELALPVVFVAFGAEEYQPSTPRRHHLGSEAYAAEHADHVVAMLALDMVGNGPATCVCWFEAGPGTLADRLAGVAAAAGITEIRVERRGDISDHGPFARRGIPAAFLWSFEDPALHSPQDTADRLDVADLQRAGDLALAWLRDLTPSG